MGEGEGEDKDKDKRVKFHLLDTLRSIRVENAALKEELAEARATAAEWRDIADLQACLADPTFPGFKPDDPESYAFPWEKTDG